MKAIKTSILVSLLLVCAQNLTAQNQKEHKKGSYIDSLNRYYQQVDLPIYIYISTSPNDPNPSALKKEEGKDSKTDNQIKPFYLDGPGIHHLKHMDAIHKQIDVFTIYGDAKAPTTKLTLSAAPMYNAANNYFFGKGLYITLSANDDMAGVKQTYVSINGGEYNEYTKPLDFTKEGDYTIQYYSVDNVGNVEKPINYKFTVDLTAPKTYHNVIGIASGQVISSASRIYLDKSDSGAGVESTYYYFDNEPAKKFVGKEIQFKQLDNGEHTLHYWSVDNVKNEEDKQFFSFYLDKIAPIASMDILGDKFIVNDKVYFSGRTKVKLTAVDNRTEVKELRYAIDNNAFQDYTEPFYMPSKAGLYTIKFYAVDETDNRNDSEDFHSRGVVYVDLSGPVLNYKFDGPIFKKGSAIFVGAKTKFNISATDSESGLKSLAYSINNGTENVYTQPFLIGTTNGKYNVTYIGYDNVNNRNQQDKEVILDVDGPQIEVRFSTDPDVNDANEKLYPSYVQVFLSATDAKTTVSSINYSINGEKEVLYVSPLRGFLPNKKYTIKISSKDVLDNVTHTEISFQTGIY